MDNQPLVLRSAIDNSVNFVEQTTPGMIEARYVRRAGDYFIAYLSSQTGCRKACRFCHLTQTGQTAFRNVTLEEYLQQAERVFAHYEQACQAGEARAESVHYNFMARGEAFANPVVLENGDELCLALADLAVSCDLVPRLKFSTIMPSEEMSGRELNDVFRRHSPDIYYSLYSVDPGFRRRWLPKALDAREALEKLARYQRLTRKVPVLHWASIAGENDSEQAISEITSAVIATGLRPDFNLVRYNSFSAAQGQESSPEVISRVAAQLEAEVPGARVKIVGRVGYDVKASCGMFVPGRARKRGSRRGARPGRSAALGALSAP